MRISNLTPLSVFGALSMISLTGAPAEAQVAPAAPKAEKQPAAAKANSSTGAPTTEKKSKPTDKDEAKSPAGTSVDAEPVDEETPEPAEQKSSKDEQSSDDAAGESAESADPLESEVVPESPTPSLTEEERAQLEKDAAEEAKAAEKEMDPADLPPAREPRPDYARLPWTHHIQHLDVMAGLRIQHAPDDGLQPFLERPVYAEGVGRVGGVLFASQPIALAVLGEVGGGSMSAGIRGLNSKLSLLHMSAGVEGRYYLHPRLYGYARLMAGAEVAWMRVGGVAHEATDSNWSFTGDGVLGAAVRLAGEGDGRLRRLRIWLLAEGGYRYSTAHEVELEYDEDTGPTRSEPLLFDDLSTSGFMGSLGLMFTY